MNSSAEENRCHKQSDEHHALQERSTDAAALHGPETKVAKRAASDEASKERQKK